MTGTFDSAATVLRRALSIGAIAAVVIAALLVGWLVKFVVFLVAMLALRDQPWVVPGVLFAAIVTTVLASLVIDAVVVSRARIPVDA
jgi:hypothetical protein